MSSILFQSPRPAHQRSATERGTARTNQWNMNEVVWPPPQEDVASPLPPRASSRAAKAAYESSLNQQSNPTLSKPFNSYTKPSRSGQSSRRDENGKSSARAAPPLSFTTPDFIAVPTNVRSRTIYSPTSAERRSEVSGAGFGEKDYPAGYAPTPRPAFQEISHPQSYTYTARGGVSQDRQLKPLIPPPQPAAPAVDAHSAQAMGFFEPFFSPADVPIHVRSPHSTAEQPFENGRAVQMCRVPSQLAPGGVIERGWTGDYLDARTRRSNSNSRSRSSGNPLTNHSHVDTHPSPLSFAAVPTYEAGETRGGISPLPIGSLGPHPPSLNLSPRADGPTPTRKGYWNQRGDSIDPSGHIRPAPRSQLYPPDLERYPKYAFMNEFGKLTLPATDDERVMLWRSYET